MLNLNVENRLNISGSKNSILEKSNNELSNQTKKQTNKWAKAGIALLLGTAFVSVGALFFIFNQKKQIPLEKVPNPLNNSNSLMNSNLQIEKGWHVNPENPDLNFLMKHPVCLPNEIVNSSVDKTINSSISNFPQVLDPVKIDFLKNPLITNNENSENISLKKETILQDNKVNQDFDVKPRVNKEAPVERKPTKRRFLYIPGKSKLVNFPRDAVENPVALVGWLVFCTKVVLPYVKSILGT